MPLRDYFQRIHELLVTSVQVGTFSLSFDERSAKAAFLHGSIALVDGSSLHFKEFIVADPEVWKVKYGYHWATKDGTLIFRYDNSADPAVSRLVTFPHHKHTPSGIEGSDQPTLGSVLHEIARLIPGS